ncbi:hypothetical protein YC2023_048788 [Brassica napus]
MARYAIRVLSGHNSSNLTKSPHRRRVSQMRIPACEPKAIYILKHKVRLKLIHGEQFKAKIKGKEISYRPPVRQSLDTVEIVDPKGQEQRHSLKHKQSLAMQAEVDTLYSGSITRRYVKARVQEAEYIDPSFLPEA